MFPLNALELVGPTEWSERERGETEKIKFKDIFSSAIVNILSWMLNHFISVHSRKHYERVSKEPFSLSKFFCLSAFPISIIIVNLKWIILNIIIVSNNLCSCLVETSLFSAILMMNKQNKTLSFGGERIEMNEKTICIKTR